MPQFQNLQPMYIVKCTHKLNKIGTIILKIDHKFDAPILKLWIYFIWSNVKFDALILKLSLHLVP